MAKTEKPEEIKDASEPKPTNGVARQKRESVKLVWNTKPKKAPNPRDLEFQPAEVVYPNKAAEGGQEMLFPRTPLGAVDDTKMNRLIWGDNLIAMQALLAQGFSGKFNTIYIDPPFNTDEDYHYKMDLGQKEFEKAPSILERLAYKDRWVSGIDSYLDDLYPRLHLLRELLADNGSLFVHVGVDVSAYVRVALDEIFGVPCFQNEIVWQRTDPHNDAMNRLGNIHDVIYWYGRSAKPAYYPNAFKDELSAAALREYSLLELPDGRVVNWSGNEGAKGRRFKLENATWKGTKNRFTWRGATPSRNREWRWASPEDMDAALSRGEIYLRDANKGAARCMKFFLTEESGVLLQDIWTNVGRMKGGSMFPTQKPEPLLEQIIRATTKEGNLIGDFYSGSGTTVAVAERLGRQWIGVDFGKVGIQVARTRLVEQGGRPFLLENIGNYQRELIYREGVNIGLMQKIVMRLYGAKPHPSHADLGVMEEKGVRKLVYVGYPDRPLTAKKTAEIVKIARSLDGEGYDKLVLLAWDYEYNYDQNLEERRRGFGVDVEPRLIPPSIYEFLRKSKNEDDLREKFGSKISFGAKPYLKLGAVESKPLNDKEHNVSVAIDRYVLAEIPVDDDKDRTELQAISKGDKFTVLIDYWAVDWDYDGKTFRSRWQDFRGNGKSTKTVGTRANTTLQSGKRYEIAVRVVDVFGNDATAMTSIDLR